MAKIYNVNRNTNGHKQEGNVILTHKIKELVKKILQEYQVKLKGKHKKQSGGQMNTLHL